jgi:hypothetical protein
MRPKWEGTMGKSIFLALAAAALATGCGRTDDGATSQAAAATAQPKKKPAFCFFESNETKGWKAARGKDGNVTVKGRAHRSDGRYKALFGPPEISGATASISPTITDNDTGFSQPDDWWDISAKIPGSASVDTVKITCGEDVLATLKVKAKA